MLGKLSLADLPTEPIVIGAVVFTILVALSILALITWFHKWTYLWKEWLTSLDHKKIGVMYIVLALVMLLRGFVDAVMMRSQQAFAVGASATSGYLPPEHYNQLFSAHGTMMIFFMAMPFLVGLMNIAVPLQIGARDVAYPFLNSVSLYLTIAAAMLVMVSLGIGEFSTAGWSGYAPYSELKYSPGVGVDYWIWALQISGVATTLTGINFLVTILKMRAWGMKLMQMPLFVWTSYFTNILMILAFPVLTVLLAMLALDRYLGMHFFTNGMGGNMMMFTNLWWAWGHPEVYILILPAFGIFSETVAIFSGKRLFGYVSLVYATIAIALLSFIVWVHHFFTMGASANVNAFFGIATMIIAVPTGVKIFNWIFTMFRGRIRFDTPMLWTLGFLVTFTVGGSTGVLMSIPAADYLVHNSLFLVAHFHNVLIPGSLFGFFAGYTLWFPKVFGFKLDEQWGKRAFWLWMTGFWLAFMPLYILGYMGMPRRMQSYDFTPWQPWLIIAAIGTALVLLGIFCQVIQLYVSIRNREKLRDLSGDPWGGRTLEWAVSSPPPVYNFAIRPHIENLDAFHDRKEKGTAYQRPESYHAIELPKNSPAGFILGVLSFTLGFGLIWYIWWLVIASLIGILLTVITRTANDEDEYVISAAEVEKIEDARYRQLAAANVIP